MRPLLIVAAYLFLCLPVLAQVSKDKGQKIRYVKMNGKRGLVRSYFPNILIPPIYDEISRISDQAFLVKRGNFYGIVNQQGTEKIKPDTYTHASLRTDLEPGKTLALLLVYKQQTEQLTLADEHGNIIARNVYEIKKKSGDLIIVTVSSVDSIQRKLFFEENEYDKIFKYGILKTDGTWLVKPEGREFGFVNDHCISAKEAIEPYGAFKLTLLNRNGKRIINEELSGYNYDLQINDSLRKINQFCVQNNLYDWFIDSMGTVVTKLPRRLLHIQVAIDSTTKKQGGKLNGAWVIQPKYDFFYITFHQYILAIDTAKKMTDIYDRSGKLLASTNFASINTPYYNLAHKRKLPGKELLFGRNNEDVFLLNDNFKPVSIAFYEARYLLYANKDISLFSFKTKEGLYGVMNQAGKVIIDPVHKDEFFEKDNFLYLKTNQNTYHVYDLNGKFHFTNVLTIRTSTLNTDICYTKTNGVETVYSLKESKVVIPAETYTDFTEVPKRGFVIASKNDEKFILDKNFQLLNKIPFKKVEQDSFGLIVTTANNKKQILNTGRNTFSDEWDTLLYAGKKMIAKSGEKFYFTDTNHVFSKKISADSIRQYTWNTSTLYKANNKWYSLNYPNPAVEFDDVLDYTFYHYVSVKKNGHYGVYSLTQGKWVVQPVFDSEVKCANHFGNTTQLFYTQKGNKKHLIDSVKNVITEPGFDFIEPTFLMIYGPNTYLENCLVNNGGKISASVTAHSIINTITGGKFGIINPKGKLLHAMNGDHVITLLDENYGYDMNYDFETATVLGFLWNSGGTLEEYTSYMPDSVEQVYYDVQGNEHTTKVAGNPTYDKKITGGKFGIVGTDGHEILPVVYDKIVFMYKDNDRERDYRKSYNNFNYTRGYDRLALFPVFLKKNNKWGAADLSGKLIIPLKYDSIADVSFQNEKMIQVWKKGKFGYVDLFGKMLLPAEYTGEQNFTRSTMDDMGSSFSILQKGGVMKNYYTVRRVEQIGYTISGEEYTQMSNDTIRLQHFADGKLGIFDPATLKPFLPAEYEDIRFMQEVNDSSLKRHTIRLSVTQKSIFDPHLYVSAYEPYLEIKKSGKWGVYNFDKGIIVDPGYEDIEVVCPVLHKDVQYATEYENQEEIEPAIGFKVKQAGKWGTLDLTGKMILKAEYDTISITEAGSYKAMKGGQENYFDTKGQPAQE